MRNREGQPDRKGHERRLTYTLLILAGLGISGFLFGTVGAKGTDEESVWWTVLDSGAQVGLVVFTAAMVLGLIELTVIESIVGRTRDEVETVVQGHHEQLHTLLGKHLAPVIGRETGIVNHWQRDDAMPDILDAIDRADEQVRLLGICHSIFWDSARLQDRPPLKDVLFDRFVTHHCKLGFSYLDRDAAALYRARDFSIRGGDGKQLLKETRQSLNIYVLPLYFNVLDTIWGKERLSSKKGEDFGERVERRMVEGFDIVEYCYLPTLSVMLVDDRMFVTPYGSGESKFGPCHEYSQWSWYSDRDQEPDDWAAFKTYHQEYSDPGGSGVRHMISPALVDKMCDDMDEVRGLREAILKGDPVRRSDIEPDQEGKYEELLRALYERFGVPIPKGRASEFAEAGSP